MELQPLTSTMSINPDYLLAEALRNTAVQPTTTAVQPTVPKGLGDYLSGLWGGVKEGAGSAWDFLGGDGDGKTSAAQNISSLIGAGVGLADYFAKAPIFEKQKQLLGQQVAENKYKMGRERDFDNYMASAFKKAPTVG